MVWAAPTEGSLCHLQAGPAIRVTEKRGQSDSESFLVALANSEFRWNQLREASHCISNNRDMRCCSLDSHLWQAFVARRHYYRIQKRNELFYIVPPAKKTDGGRNPELFSQTLQRLS